jgi:hypothetical protein
VLGNTDGLHDAPVAQLDRASVFEAGNQTYEILPEPTQPARKQQVVTNRGKSFSPSFFAFCAQFIRTFQHLYYVSTTFEWLSIRRILPWAVWTELAVRVPCTSRDFTAENQTTHFVAFPFGVFVLLQQVLIKMASAGPRASGT